MVVESAVGGVGKQADLERRAGRLQTGGRARPPRSPGVRRGKSISGASMRRTNPQRGRRTCSARRRQRDRLCRAGPRGGARQHEQHQRGPVSRPGKRFRKPIGSPSVAILSVRNDCVRPAFARGREYHSQQAYVAERQRAGGKWGKGRDYCRLRFVWRRRRGSFAPAVGPDTRNNSAKRNDVLTRRVGMLESPPTEDAHRLP